MVKKNPRIFMHCWLEYKLEQIFEDTVWHFLKMLNMELLYDLCVCVVSCFSHVQLFETLWTIACQAPLSMGILQARMLELVAMPFSRGYLHHPEIEPMSPVDPALQVDSLPHILRHT